MPKYPQLKKPRMPGKLVKITAGKELRALDWCWHVDSHVVSTINLQGISQYGKVWVISQIKKGNIYIGS